MTHLVENVPIASSILFVLANLERRSDDAIRGEDLIGRVAAVVNPSLAGA